MNPSPTNSSSASTPTPTPTLQSQLIPVSETMRPASPHGGVVLPPPIPQSQTDHSYRSLSKSPRTALTLPPLSTLSPLRRPSTSASSTPRVPLSAPSPTAPLSNLIHPVPEKRGESSTTPLYRRDSREMSPRARARRQSMGMEAPRQSPIQMMGFETIEEHAVLGPSHGQNEHRQRRPRHSMPAGERPPYMQHPPYAYAVPVPRSGQSWGESAGQPVPQSNIPRYSSGEWPQRPVRPSVEVNPRRSRPPTPSGNGPWFTIDDTPSRSQLGWSQANVESYNAGWGDALRAVEGGMIGVGGHQYSKPRFIANTTIPRTLPPPLRQSSSSDPGPPIYPAASPFDDSHPRSMSFGSAYPSPQPPHRHHPYGSYSQAQGRPSTSHTPTSSYPLNSTVWSEHNRAPYARPPTYGERHSYSSTSTSLSAMSTTHSPTSPSLHSTFPNTHSQSGSQGGERRSQRQAISCFPCRGRKLKCDGGKPCSQCTRRNGDDECGYAATVKRRGKGKKDKDRSGDEEDRASSGSREEDTEMGEEGGS